VSVRVLIVDDHPVVRTGIRGMLEGQPDFVVVGEATNGEEAVNLVGRLDPDVVLMDLRMPGGLTGWRPPPDSPVRPRVLRRDLRYSLRGL
jgi:DNA-binding NarL/FixJ family response regulator